MSEPFPQPATIVRGVAVRVPPVRVQSIGVHRVSNLRVAATSVGSVAWLRRASRPYQNSRAAHRCGTWYDLDVNVVGPVTSEPCPARTPSPNGQDRSVLLTAVHHVAEGSLDPLRHHVDLRKKQSPGWLVCLFCLLLVLNFLATLCNSHLMIKLLALGLAK